MMSDYEKADFEEHEAYMIALEEKAKLLCQVRMLSSGRRMPHSISVSFPRGGPNEDEEMDFYDREAVCGFYDGHCSNCEEWESMRFPLEEVFQADVVQLKATLALLLKPYEEKRKKEAYDNKVQDVANLEAELERKKAELEKRKEVLASSTTGASAGN